MFSYSTSPSSALLSLFSLIQGNPIHVSFRYDDDFQPTDDETNRTNDADIDLFPDGVNDDTDDEA